jgi:hypothetical protein
MCFSCFIPLVKVNILLVNVNILVKLNILKSHGFFVVIRNWTPHLPNDKPSPYITTKCGCISLILVH